MIAFSFLLAFLAVAAMICSLVFCSEWSIFLSNVSTIMSIILGIMSIVYSYRSNKATDKLLNSINDEFEKVAKNAQTSLIERNIDKENFEGVSKLISER